jgi:hypothetical protein
MRLIPFMLVWAVLQVPSRGATVQFVQDAVNDVDGSPVGAVSSLSFVESGVGYETVAAPVEYGGLRLTHWSDSSSPSVSYRDPWGRSLNPATMVLDRNTTATAHYLPSGRDVDNDGVPDWYEIEYYGTLANDASSDSDGDGLSLLAELSGGTSPLFGDSSDAGGVSGADSGMVTVNLAGYATYVIASNPAGVVDQSAVAAPGTVVTTPDLAGNVQFGYWTIDGVRQADAWGVAYPVVSFTMGTEDVAAVAQLFAGDSDGDGIPDAYEQYHYGSLANDAASDSDGDGLSLITELSGGTSPLFGDRSDRGGVSWADSGMVTVNLAGYATYAFTSNPAGAVDQSAVAAPGTVVTTPDLSGNVQFGYWTIDGVRQADVWGVAYPVVSFTMDGKDRSGVAYLFAGDGDGDGIPDAFEQYYYGTTGNGASSDSDGDGLSLMAELSGGTSPLFGDRSDPGGVSWAQSGFVIVDANDSPTAVPLSLTRLSGTPMRISMASIVSAGASDPDGHALTVSSVGPSQQGANVRISGSSILYSPVNDQDDSFPYTVRDPGGLTATSTVNVRVVGLAGKIGSFTLNASGQPVMQFAGIPGYRYAIERSPDLTNWETIHSLTAPSAGLFQFTDPAAPGGSMYYRLRYVP